MASIQYVWYGNRFYLGTIPISSQQKFRVGGVRKIVIFADIQCYLCWRRVGRWVWKQKSKKVLTYYRDGLLPLYLSHQTVRSFTIPAATFSHCHQSQKIIHHDKGDDRIFLVIGTVNARQCAVVLPVWALLLCVNL